MKEALQTSGYGRGPRHTDPALKAVCGLDSPQRHAVELQDRPADQALAANSFEHVYRRHAGFVRSVLIAMGMAANADDALQEVFMVVHRRLREYDGRFAMRSWLYAIARRVASHHRRSLRRRAFACEPIERDVADCALGPLELAEQRETLDELEALFADMDPEKRQLLVLADVEQRSVPEIAELTGTCLSTLYTRLRRARRSLQASAGWQNLLSQHGHQQPEVTACGF